MINPPVPRETTTINKNISNDIAFPTLLIVTCSKRGVYIGTEGTRVQNVNQNADSNMLNEEKLKIC